MQGWGIASLDQDASELNMLTQALTKDFKSKVSQEPNYPQDYIKSMTGTHSQVISSRHPRPAVCLSQLQQLLLSNDAVALA